MQKKKTRIEKVEFHYEDGTVRVLTIECLPDEGAYVDLSRDGRHLELKKRKKLPTQANGGDDA